jgi:hypothetical protein
MAELKWPRRSLRASANNLQTCSETSGPTGRTWPGRRGARAGRSRWSGGVCRPRWQTARLNSVTPASCRCAVEGARLARRAAGAAATPPASLDAGPGVDPEPTDTRDRVQAGGRNRRRDLAAEARACRGGQSLVTAVCSAGRPVTCVSGAGLPAARASRVHSRRPQPLGQGRGPCLGTDAAVSGAPVGDAPPRRPQPLPQPRDHTMPALAVAACALATVCGSFQSQPLPSVPNARGMAGGGFWGHRAPSHERGRVPM